MADAEFDVRELDEFTKELLELAEKTMPKESKKFLQVEGNKLRRITAQKARELIKKPKTRNYFKGIKRGKVYRYKDDKNQLSIRIYGSSPHSHLLEYGHRMVGHKPDKEELGFVKGYRIFEKAAKEFENEYFNDCEKFVEDMLEKGLS